MMAESTHDRIERERDAALPRAKRDVPDFRRYSQGVHDATLTPEQQEILRSVTNHEFADNACDVILTTAASRLDLTGFAVDNEPVQAFLDGLFTKNQLGDLAFDTHYRASRDGNHALGLRWASGDRPKTDEAVNPEADVQVNRGDGRVTIHHEPWWDGEFGMFVGYDDMGEPAYACKDFAQLIDQPDGPPRVFNRRTVYFPDRIERYLQAGAGWIMFPLEGEPWPAPWTKRNGEPLGIPIIHFANSRFGLGPYGASDLAGGVLGLQDELNDIQRDITAAARLLGYPMLVGKGLSATAAASLTVGPGQVHGVPKDGDLSVLQPGDMTPLLAVYQHKLATISRNTSTPNHLITGGDWPAGVALLRAEMPLVSKVERMAKTIGPAWATAAHRATEFANAFGSSGLDENALITAEFAAPEKLDEQALVEIQLNRARMLEIVLALNSPAAIAKTGIWTEDEAMAILTERDSRAVVGVF